MTTNTRPRLGRRLALTAAKLSLLGMSILVALAGIELALRATGAKPLTATALSAYFEFSPETGWIGRPHSAANFTTAAFDAFISHDATGLRRCGREGALDDDGHFEGEVVWCLGDSGTWGWGIDDGYTYVDLLNEIDGEARLYRNFGMCGYSSVQQWLLLKDFFARGQRPDRVVILFCGNDLEENLDKWSQDPPRPYFEVIDGTLELQNYPVRPSHNWNARAWFKKHSLAYNYLNYYLIRAKNRLREWRNPTAPVVQPGVPADAPTDAPTEQDAAQEMLAAATSGAAHGATGGESAATLPLGAQFPEPLATQLRALGEAYRLTKALCDEYGVELAVATESHVQADWLRQVCTPIDVPVLDLWRHWHAYLATHDEPTSFHTDPHFNRLGHRLLAESIRSELTRLDVAARREAGTAEPR